MGVWKLTRSRAIAGAILLHMAAVLPIFVTERYRIAVVPGLLVFAAVGLSELWMDCSLLHFRRIVAYFIVLGGALWIVTIPRTDPALWAIQSYNLGRAALDSGDLARAEQHLSRAQIYASENPEINFALANLRLAQGNRPAALSLYAAVLRIDPSHKAALNNLGVMALDEGKFAEAVRYFRKSLEQEPGSAKTYYLLARTEISLGDFENAKVDIVHALEIDPTRPEYRDVQKDIERHGH
jgi:tetratricopeptide (TPR) repeat protein